MKELCKEKIADMIDDFICQERFGEVLEMITRFPQMNFENILLLLHQFPQATVVCGKGAWNSYHATIKEGEKPIALFIPAINRNDYKKEAKDVEKWETNVYYDVIPVYDILQVSIKDDILALLKRKELSENRIEQVLKEKFHLSVLEDIEETYVGRNHMIKSKYKEEINCIFLRPGLSRQIREVELLKYYIRMQLKDKKLVSYAMELEHYIKIILGKYFSIQGIDAAIRTTELFFATQEEKRELLQQLSEIVFQLILELTGERKLSFIQTVCCNLFFESENISETMSKVGVACEMADTDNLHKELLSFLEWMQILSKEDYQYIQQKRLHQTLFTFPLVVLPTKNSKRT